MTIASKITTLIFFIICCSLVNAQGLNFEKGYNDHANQSPTAVLCVDDYSYLGYKQSTLGFSTFAYLLKHDSLGNELWNFQIIPVFGAELVEISGIFPAEDGGVYVCGEGYVICDVAGIFGFVMKISESGGLLWTELVETDFMGSGLPLLWSAKAFSQISSEKIVFAVNGLQSVDDFTAIIAYNGDGEMTDSLIIEEQVLEGFISYGAYEFLGYHDDNLYAYDETGTLSETVLLADVVRDLKVIDDQLYILHPFTLAIYDTELNLVDDYIFVDYEDFYNLKEIDDQISFISANDDATSTLIYLDENFEPETTITFDVKVGENTVQDYSSSHLTVAEAYALTQKTAVRYRDFSMYSTEDVFVNTTDIAVVNIDVVDYIIGSEIAENLYYISVDANVLIKNEGINTLNSARLNKNLGYGICNTAYYSEEFYDLDLAPGDSVWIEIGVVGLPGPHTIPPGSTSLNTVVCVYSSHPNSVTDLNVENDELCKNIEITIIGVDELEQVKLSVYPNPVEEYLYVESLPGKLLSYEVLGANGKVMLSGKIDSNSIEVNSLATGLYILRVWDESGAVYYSSPIVKQ